MRIKICGITRPADAAGASQAGADLLGFNFHPASPRCVAPARLDALLAAVQPPALPVAVTVNMPPGEAIELAGPAGRRRFPVVQLHGREPPSAADELIAAGLKVIKAFGVGGADFHVEVSRWLAGLRRRDGLLAVLLDAAGPGGRPHGGSGRTLNWDWIASAGQAKATAGWPPILLAGGLDADNVIDAVRTARPWGVDVAGGVESAPGVKSLDKVRAFIRAARLA